MPTIRLTNCESNRTQYVVDASLSVSTSNADGPRAVYVPCRGNAIDIQFTLVANPKAILYHFPFTVYNTIKQAIQLLRRGLRLRGGPSITQSWNTVRRYYYHRLPIDNCISEQKLYEYAICHALPVTPWYKTEHPALYRARTFNVELGWVHRHQSLWNVERDDQASKALNLRSGSELDRLRGRWIAPCLRTGSLLKVRDASMYIPRTLYSHSAKSCSNLHFPTTYGKLEEQAFAFGYGLQAYMWTV